MQSQDLHNTKYLKSNLQAELSPGEFIFCLVNFILEQSSRKLNFFPNSL